MNRKLNRYILLLLLAVHLPAMAAYDYVMKINRAALAVVDSNVVASLHITAIQDVPAMQSVVLVPVLEDTVSTGRISIQSCSSSQKI